MDRAVALALAILTSVPGAGCSLASEKQGVLETKVPEARITSAQFRLWVSDAVLHSADRIQEAAERIQADARDPVVRRNAILWKANAIPALFRAATRRDAFGSFVDLWIFSKQMADFFDDSSGRGVFGVHQAVALTTAEAIEARLEKMFASALKPEGAERSLREIRKYAESFATEHPLRNLSFVREPITGHAESHIASAMEGLGGVVSGMEQDLLTLQRIVAAYLEYLPSISRWQAELMLEDLGKSGIVAESLSMVRDMAAATKAIPEIVTGQTTRILSAAAEERKAAMSGIEEMRVATVKTMEAERKAITAEIDRQRLETLEEVRGERKTVLEDIRAVVRETTASVVSPGKQLIDYLVGRVVLIVSGIAGVFALGLGLVVIFLRSKAAGPPSSGTL